MQKENGRVKINLVLQSFAPLFLLLTIKYLHLRRYCYLVYKFLNELMETGINVVSKTVNHIEFGEFVVSVVGIGWLLLTIAIALGFNEMQNAGFESNGEKIIVENTTNDSGVAFLLTYVLPLLTDDIGSVRGLVVFLTTLAMIILLLSRSNMFYQNPVLTAMKYRTFSFRFVETEDDNLSTQKTYIGITYGKPIDEKKIIKQKYISDGVFLIYNDNN